MSVRSVEVYERDSASGIHSRKELAHWAGHAEMTIPFTTEEIEKAVKKLKNNKAQGLMPTLASIFHDIELQFINDRFEMVIICGLGQLF